MIGPGERLPGARVWLSPREAVDLRDLGEGSALLLLFYLFDWSST